MAVGGGSWRQLLYYSETYDDDIPVYTNMSWFSEAYRTIEITGGRDASNTKVLEWLQTYAVQQS